MVEFRSGEPPDLIDDDGEWTRMGGALCLTKPSAAFEARRQRDAAVNEARNNAEEAKAAVRTKVENANLREKAKTLHLAGELTQEEYDAFVTAHP